jgi:hypothetical protein
MRLRYGKFNWCNKGLISQIKSATDIAESATLHHKCNIARFFQTSFSNILALTALGVHMDTFSL